MFVFLVCKVLSVTACSGKDFFNTKKLCNSFWLILGYRMNVSTGLTTPSFLILFVWYLL